MAAYEVLLLNTAIPQIQAAQSGDTYVVPRDIAINATAIISANSATDALRITQTGAGNAILVEDSANPDSTPFVVTAAGDVGVGTTSPFTRLDSASARAATLNSIASFNTMPASVTDTTAFASGVGGGINFRARLNSSGYSTYASIWSYRESGITDDYRGSLIFGTADNGDGYPEERARIDSSGNLGLGVTPSAWGSGKAIELGQVTGNALWGLGINSLYLISNARWNGSNYVYTNNGAANLYGAGTGNGTFTWFTAPSGTAGNAISFTQAMTLDASGNLLVGKTASYLSFRLQTNNGNGYAIENSAGTGQAAWFAAGGSLGLVSGNFAVLNGADGILFGAASTERARITSGGYFKASNNGNYVGTTSNYHELRTNAADYSAYISNSNASSPYGFEVTYTGTDPNGTSNRYIGCYATSTQRMEVRSNGGIANYQANDVNLSDRREKTNFAPAKSYLDVICAIPVQTFNYIDQSENDPGLTLGVVAQDVQAVAPELVMESNWGTEDNPKMRLSIYQTDLQYALMKCIQEQQAMIDELKAEVAALKGA